MRVFRVVSVVATALVLAVSASVATAETATGVSQQRIPVGEAAGPRVPARLGIGATVGAGVAGFSRNPARTFFVEGGFWELRLIGGTRRSLGFEVAYCGAVHPVPGRSPGEPRSTLWTNAVEWNLRLNWGTSFVQPFAVVGASWKRYLLRRYLEPDGSDVFMELPLGVGGSLHLDGYLLEVRGVYRIASAGGDTEPLNRGPWAMNNWNFSAAFGWEF